MKAIILACLLVCLLAVNPMEKFEALARQDDCVANVFDLIKPEIDAKLEELKNVIFISFRTTTSHSKLKLLLLCKRERPCSTSAMPPSLNQFSETSSNGTELPSSWPPTASRTSELSSSSLTQSSKAPRTTPMMLLSPSLDTSSADKWLMTANNSSTSSSDLSHTHYHQF